VSVEVCSYLQWFSYLYISIMLSMSNRLLIIVVRILHSLSLFVQTDTPESGHTPFRLY